ncbi:DUF6893 family small protein [Mycolicibacterium helvum]|jgi:hypothetical protein
MATIGWVATVAVGVIIVGGVVVGVSSIPDIRRYLKMRSM